MESPEKEMEYEFPRRKEPGQHGAVCSHGCDYVVMLGYPLSFQVDPPKSGQR
jgi:hypothetical protein